MTLTPARLGAAALAGKAGSGRVALRIWAALVVGAVLSVVIGFFRTASSSG